jgi:hypothetical protein
MLEISTLDQNQIADAVTRLLTEASFAERAGNLAMETEIGLALDGKHLHAVWGDACGATSRSTTAAGP